MVINPRLQKTLTVRFLDEGPTALLELTNSTEQTQESFEFVTVFFKDEAQSGGPSRVHMRFDLLRHTAPKERAIMAHITRIDGRPLDAWHDQLGRLKVIEGKAMPYVLQLSRRDTQGKSRFQAIAVGH